jgi:hypothetical protein
MGKKAKPANLRGSGAPYPGKSSTARKTNKARAN